MVTWSVPVDDFALHRVHLGGDGAGRAGPRGATDNDAVGYPHGTGARGAADARGSGGVDRVVLDLPGPRVVLCTAGKVTALDGTAGAVTLTPGQAAIGRAGAGPLALTGDGEAFVASLGALTSGGAGARACVRGPAATAPGPGLRADPVASA